MSEDLWMIEQNKGVTRIIKALQESAAWLEDLQCQVDLTKKDSRKLGSVIKRAKRALEGVR